MALCCESQVGEEWVIIIRYGRRLERSWECSFYFECDLRLLVKASGVILLLGVGSLVCYKLYHYYWPRSRSRLNSPNSSPPHSRHRDSYVTLRVSEENQLVEDIDEEDISSIEGRYFGPSPVPNSNYTSGSFDISQLLARTSSESDGTSSHSESGKSGEDECRDADLSDGRKGKNLSPFQKRFHLQKSGGWRSSLTCLERKAECGRQAALNSGWLLKRLKNVLMVSPPNKKLLGTRSISLPVTPGRKLKSISTRNKDRKHVPAWEEEWKLIGETSNEWEKLTQCHSSVTRGMHRTNLSEEVNSSHLSSIPRDDSLDSLGFSKRLAREGSFDSTCSELSLEFSLPEAVMDTSTMLYLDNLQQEIDQLKNNCLLMDEEFEIIKCNRNLPGMSNLMKVNMNTNSLCTDSLDNNPVNTLNENQNQESARACFAGLYSLTTIKNSTSSELSDSCAVIGNGRASAGSAESLDWDSPKSVASPNKLNSPSNPSKIAEENGDSLSYGKRNDQVLSTLKSESVLVPSEAELMAHLEWDEEDLLEYSEGSSQAPANSCLLANMTTLEMDLEVELTTHNEGCRTRSCSPNERSSKLESSSGFESRMIDSATTVFSDWEPNDNPWTYCSSEESGYMECSAVQEKEKQYCFSDEETAMAQSSSCVSEQSTPLSESESHTLENVGRKINVFEYAMQEWRGQTKRAETMLKGYAEISTVLGLQHLRKIRGDNYCGVRAAIFQTLAHGFPVPCGENTFECLSHALNNEGCSWIQDWTFAERLPYRGNNVLHGMKTCLHNLDNVASLLASSQDREDTLAAILNSDQSLDLHLVEAMKLHMLVCAMKLHQVNLRGDDVPLFAMLMFARDTSETPRDLMNNHLQEVGNTGGLEQVEMFLLGYTLGVTLRVVRPSAYGTEDFVSCYPDWNIGSWPQVCLIAEDDRHYNVLVS